MAGKTEVESLQQVASTLTLTSTDQERLLRPSLGEESLKDELGPELDQFVLHIHFAIEHAPHVHNDRVNEVRKIVEGVAEELKLQIGRDNSEYVARRQAFLNAVRRLIEELRIPWPHFVAAAVYSRGLLEDEGIQKEYERIVRQMHDDAAATIKEVKDESEKILTEAKQFAEKIEKKARDTAKEISVGEAVKQFGEARRTFNNQVKIWGGLSIVSIIMFMGLALFLWQSTIPAQTTGEAIYHTAIRITVLTAVGAVATFCLRILRAQLHMQQHNLHRQRVANSMPAFVQSAETREQRDLILAQLVDAVASFGNSGLLPESDDSIAPTKLAIDSVTRNIISQQK